MKKILVIEHDPSRCEQIRAVFSQKSPGHLLQFVPSRSQALELAAGFRPDFVFLKSESDGLADFLPRLAEAAPASLPVLIAERPDAQSLLESLKAGIVEYVGADSAAIADFPAAADRAWARYQARIAGWDQSLAGRNLAGERGSPVPEPDTGRLKDLLYQSASLAVVGSLVSGIVHEINNQLTGTLAYAELLAMKVTDENVKTDLEKIAQSADRCRKIVDNLLAFSRPRAAAKSIGSVNSILEQTIELRTYALRSENIEVVRQFEAEGAILVDVQQIEQALLYVILNAEEATVLSARSPRKITFTTREDRNDRTVMIQIADTGPGLGPDIISRIFEPFFTTKPGKCGLGLSLARDIISRHGGTIQADNHQAGSIFTIILPTGA